MRPADPSRFVGRSRIGRTSLSVLSGPYSDATGRDSGGRAGVRHRPAARASDRRHDHESSDHANRRPSDCGGQAVTRLILGSSHWVCLRWHSGLSIWPVRSLSAGRVSRPRRTATHLELECRSVGRDCFFSFHAGSSLADDVVASANSRAWRLRHSLSISAGVIVAFAAGIFMIGVVHQSGWIFASDEPLIVESEMSKHSMSDSKNNLKMLSLGLQNQFIAFQGQQPTKVEADGAVHHGWGLQVLIGCGYTDGNEAGERIDYGRSWTDPANKKLYSGVVPLFVNVALKGAPFRNADSLRSGPLCDELPGDDRRHSHSSLQNWRRPFQYALDRRGERQLPALGGPRQRPRSGARHQPVRSRLRRPDWRWGGCSRWPTVRCDLSAQVSPAVLKALATPNGGDHVDVEALPKR